MTQLTYALGAPEAMSVSSASNVAAETVKVVVRCRPLSQNEIKDGHDKIVAVDAKRGVIEVSNPKATNEPPKCFTFDSVYDDTSKQIDLYYETFRDLVESVLNGYNGTIFAYGQTGTGKTFTMEGIKEDPDLRGVIPNAIDHIFRHIAQAPPNQQYLVRASYLEIYQEEIWDLVDDSSPKRKKKELKEGPTGVCVKDLTSHAGESMEDIMKVMYRGNSNRSVGRTNMNEHSSRSHAIFIITVECDEKIDGESHFRIGQLNLVDLAGSERQSKTGSEGERFKEATKINLSLSALGNVISALVDGKSSHIPYRDSKLTRLLRDSLGGNSKTVMVANIGPASYNFEETLSTLRYANRAKNIKNKPKINEDPKDAMLREFQEEIARLMSELANRRTSAGRRRRRRNIGMTESELVESDLSAEEVFREKQAKLDEEREALIANGGMREEERQRLLDNLEDRQKQLVMEQESQAKVAKKLRDLQSKLLSGTGNLLDQTKVQQKLLQAKRIELADQKRREREILQQLEAQEDNTAEINQTCANLKQEVELKTKKLQKLMTKYQQTRLEIQDAADTFSKERQQLEQSISEMNKELKLKWLVMENFIPVSISDKLRERAVFDEDQACWKILKPGERLNSQNSLQAPEKNMFDSGLGQGISDGSNSMEDGQLTPIKRPISLMGLRRPATNFEREAMTLIKQRARSARTAHAFSSPEAAVAALAESNSVDSAFVPDNVLRFCGENVISFASLKTYPSKVSDYQPAAAPGGSRIGSAALKEKNDSRASQNVVIEVTKIPAPRSTSRDARATNNLRRLSTSTPSKNVRARSAHGRVVGTPSSPAGSLGSVDSAGPCPEDRESGKSGSVSPGLVTTSSSSSNDQGLGDEVPDDPVPLDDLAQLVRSLQIDGSFLGSDSPLFDHSAMQFPSSGERPQHSLYKENRPYDFGTTSRASKPPLPTPVRKTRIPVLHTLSKSMSEPRRMFPGTDGGSRSNTPGPLSSLSSSFHECSSGGFIPRYSVAAQGSQEQLAPREPDPVQEGKVLLQMCRDRTLRRSAPPSSYFSERSVIMPLRRDEPGASSNRHSMPRILTPFHELDLESELPPPCQPVSSVEKYMRQVVHAGERLKHIERDILFSPTRSRTDAASAAAANSLGAPPIPPRPRIEPNPDCERYKNAGGGRVIPIERKVAIRRTTRGLCDCCRVDGSLHRLRTSHYCQYTRVRSKVTKYYVVQRDRCRCCAKCTTDEDSFPSNSANREPLFLDSFPFNYIVFFAFIAFIFRVLLALFFRE